jgi:hypothetical protein
MTSASNRIWHYVFGGRSIVQQDDLLVNLPNDGEDDTHGLPVSSTINVKSLGALSLGALNWRAMGLRFTFCASGAFLSFRIKNNE